MLSLLFHLAMAVLAFCAVASHARHRPLKDVLRYFTAQSNLLCAAASLILAAMRLSGVSSAPVLLFNYVGTVAVAVTLLTVLVFLGPQFGYKPLFSGPDFLLHLVCPLLALIAYFAWDRVPLSPLASLIGVIPVLLYGCLYLHKVVYAKQWEDFYGFNRDGKWPVSFAAMVAGTAVLCLLMRL